MKSLLFSTLVGTGILGIANTHAFAPPLLTCRSTDESKLQVLSSSHSNQDSWDRFVHSAETDPYLQGVFQSRPKPLNPLYMEHEEHRHDSLLDEIQHAIEHDPDLQGVVGKEKAMNIEFMEQELHRHDSYWNEIEHAVDTDPYLAT